MKTKTITIMTILFLASIVVIAVPVVAKGGSSKGTDVWFKYAPDGGTRYQGIYQGIFQGIFYTTGSGIVHQRRYEPNDLHLVFKPVANFPNPPDEGGWFLWPYHATAYYEDPSWPDEGNLGDFFTDGAQYWVEITTQS